MPTTNIKFLPLICAALSTSSAINGVQGLIQPPSWTRGASFSTRSQRVSVRQASEVHFDDFLRDKEKGDFFQLEAKDEEFGPGPVIIFYNVPQGIEDTELLEMLRDGAPQAIKKGVSLSRMDSSTSEDWMRLTVNEALKKVVRSSRDPSTRYAPAPLTTDAGLLATTPVLFFSGFKNSEMMGIFNIIAHEVHKETSGRLSVACAMAIPDVMQKPLQQVLQEISGDHQEAVMPKLKRP